MRSASTQRAPVLRLGVKLLPGHLLPGERVPETEFGTKATIGFLGNAASHQRLGIDDLPVFEARRGVRIGNLLNEGALVNRREEARTLQVGSNHLRNLRAHIALQEVRHRNWHRLDIAFSKIEGDQRVRRRRKGCGPNQACNDHQSADEGTLDHIKQAFQHLIG